MKEYKFEGWKLENEVCRLAIRRYLERWRKQFGKSLRHWIVTEKGQEGTERIHMHGIVWTNEDKNVIEEKWSYGWCEIGKKGVGEESAGYLVKYMSKVDERHRDFKSKVFTSAGIGRKYIEREDSNNNKFRGKDTKEVYRNRKGQSLSLPQYYRHKLYNEEEREELWMLKLDKERRFVLGQEIDVSTEEGQKDYERVRDIARKKNKKYGYGDGSVDWDKVRYNNSLKKLKKWKN